MSRPLDVPDGLQCIAVEDPDGPMIEFYTGRWEIRYNREEVIDLIIKLQRWLDNTE